MASLDAINGEIERVGYEVKGEFGILGRRYFQKGGDERTHQVHAFTYNDENVFRHIAFRDYLCLNSIVTEEYSALKKRVANQCNHDIVKYCDGKDAFVKHHEKIALKLKNT